MKSNKAKIGVLLLTPLLAVSCDSSVDSQTDLNNTDPVVASSKPTVALTAEQVNAVVGDSFTVDIAMSNFPTSEGGGVSVQFDPNLLSASDVLINSANWNFVNKVGAIDNNTGVISDILFSSYQGVTDDSTIVSITFTAIGSGSSQIILSGSSINPFSSNGSTVAANFVNSNVQITAN